MIVLEIRNLVGNTKVYLQSAIGDSCSLVVLLVEVYEAVVCPDSLRRVQNVGYPPGTEEAEVPS